MYEIKLIALYFYVCERYEERLKYVCQRFSNNHKPLFSDEEVLTVYLHCISEERRFQIRDIHRFTQRHLHDWFPHLPSYKAFNNRLNRLSAPLQFLCAELLDQHVPCGVLPNHSVVDSLPIVTCSGKRVGKVAPELTNKGHAATKGMYYYGMRLHALCWRHPSTLPWIEYLEVSPAAENDLNIFKQSLGEVPNRTFFGDKIYHNKEWFAQFASTCNSVMLTPVKKVKNMPEWLRQWNRCYDQMYSKAVSAIRQPIESLFNWLNEKTGIQNATKVRSTKGLLVHVFGKLAAAFITLVLNP